MIAEQMTTSRFWAGGAVSPIRIDLALRLEIPAQDPFVHVAVDLVYEPQTAGSLEERLQQHLYDGVHAGIAAIGFPVPDGGIGARISSFQIAPPPDSDLSQSAAEQLAALTDYRRSLVDYFEWLQEHEPTLATPLRDHLEILRQHLCPSRISA
ncbi:MAG: hypothetical protein HY329_15895 [Chloroflexi bacterium]|nr:hypothetical protein [Chloroflexota bacterium]